MGTLRPKYLNPKPLNPKPYEMGTWTLRVGYMDPQGKFLNLYREAVVRNPSEPQSLDFLLVYLLAANSTFQLLGLL